MFRWGERPISTLKSCACHRKMMMTLRCPFSKSHKYHVSNFWRQNLEIQIDNPSQGAVSTAYLVFTDGACEGAEGQKTGSVGGVLVSPEGKLVQFFGGNVPDALMSVLLKASKNPIYELEVLPVLMAVALWGGVCSLSQVCWYLDNDAGRSAFIKAYGATSVADGMLEDFTAEEMRLQIKSWFARVPSASNLADAPSRNDDAFLTGSGATKVFFSWHGMEQKFVSWSSRNGGGRGSWQTWYFPRALRGKNCESVRPSEAVHFIQWVRLFDVCFFCERT